MKITRRIIIALGLIVGSMNTSPVKAINLADNPHAEFNHKALFSCGDSITFIYREEVVTYGTVERGGLCWMDRNLGASHVPESFGDPKGFGDLFQWGRGDDGHQDRGSETTDLRSSSETPGHNKFILLDGSPSNWLETDNPSLWLGVDGTNNPCPPGWRLPSSSEIDSEYRSWSSRGTEGAFLSTLKWPGNGSRLSNTGELDGRGEYGTVWTSDEGDSDIRMAYYESGVMRGNAHRASGSGVRCVRGLNESHSSARKHFFYVEVSQPHSLIADAGEDVEITLGDSISIGGNPSADLGYGNYTYQWTPGDYLDDPNSPNPVATPPTTTEYHLLVTDKNNCTAEDSIEVSVRHIPPELEFSINDESFDSGELYAFCYDQPVNIKLTEVHAGSPPFEIVITINEEDDYVFSDVDLANPRLFEGTPDVGLHSITFTKIADANGAVVEDPEVLYNALIEVMDLPVAEITPDGDLEFCEGGSVELTASEAHEYLWRMGETTRSIIVDQSGGFNVTVTDANGCQNTSDVVEVIVWDLPDVSCPDDLLVRFSDQAFDLKGANPGGGTYTGEGVSDGQFDPVEAGAGKWIITYNYTDDVTGCENSCSFEIEVTDDTSIRETDQDNVQVFPNPTTGLINITSEQPIQKVMMYDMQGQLVYSSNVDDQSHIMHVTEMNQGVYFLQILLKDGVHTQMVQIK